MQQLPGFSIVIEWENAKLSEFERARRMLEVLGEQLRELRERLPEPPEIILLYDPREMEGKVVREAVEEQLGHPELAVLHFVETEGEDYFQQKNLGARVASQDVVILLDSDVVPRRGWLQALLEAMADLENEVVAGQTGMSLESFVGRAFALFWIFPPERGGDAIRPTDHFHANNVAFRRERLLASPFPDLPVARGQSTLLGQQLAAAGRRMALHEGARVEHAPPNGFAHLVRRAMNQGRDDYLIANERAPHLYESRIANALWRFRKRVLRAGKRIVKKRQTVGFGLVGALGAAALACLYYASYALGLAITLVDRDWVYRRFPI